ncbi:MAG TPA: hypothetical protein VMM82_00580, partial [Spirochaetia bacterium]|nr:hypothetical protein [Spirochaetia bacterium]
MLILLVASGLHAQSAESQLNAGKKAFSDGFYSVAEESFQRVVSAYPSTPQAVEADYLVGVSRFYAGEWR